MVTFELPWPPTANNSKFWVQKGKKGYFASTTELKQYHRVCIAIIQAQGFKPIAPPYHVMLYFSAPRKVTRYDIANYEKAPIDAMKKAGLIADDSKIKTLILRKGIKASKEEPEGSVTVHIYETEW